MTKEKTSTGGTFRKTIIALIVLLIIGLGGAVIFYYLRYYGPNVTDNQKYLFIHTGEGYDSVYKTIRDEGLVKDTTTFNWAAHNMKYVDHVKPGKYRLKSGMSNHALVRMLQLGEQEPVDLSFHTFRTKEQFAVFLSNKLETDSTTFLRYLDSAQFVQQYGFNTDNAFVMILPDSYQFNWNVTPAKFFKHMYTHYQNFWTPERKQKAAEINLSPIQVSILAAIVDAEALHDDEMPTIAGLYLNRLKMGMKLESDPTVIFAMHDFTIHRVLNRYLLNPSPYNTYAHTGLPPGPVMMPSVNAVNSVLDYKKNDYLYMVAKDDFSGYHNFATNHAEHMVNAHKFQQALNERNIKR
jgi:UPF0755 protein